MEEGTSSFDDVSLKSLGLAVLSLIVEHLEEDAEGGSSSPSSFTQQEKEAILAPAIAELADYASSLPPKALFDNWAPGNGRHSVPLLFDYNPEQHLGRAADGTGAVASASSNKTDKTPASRALSESATEAWSSVNDATSSWWQVQLRQPTYLQSATITWRTEATVKSTPESYTFSVSSDGNSWTQIGPAVVLDSFDSKVAMSRQRLAIDSACSFVRIEMKGYSKAVAEAPGTVVLPGKTAAQPKEKAHGIASFRLFVPDTAAVHVAPSTTLMSLEKLLLDAALSTKNGDELSRCLRALQSLSLASGSTQGLLKTMAVLLALQDKTKLQPGDNGNEDTVPDKFLALARDSNTGAVASLLAGSQLSLKSLPKDAASQAALDSFIRGLDEATNAELETLLLPQVAGIISGSSADGGLGGAGGSAGPLRPCFDPSAINSGMELSEGNTVVRSTSSSRCCVYGVAGFSRGRVAWEFKCLEDTQGDEYLCYGCGSKPKTDDNYDSSRNLWMIRAYNGKIHQMGSSGRTIEKIHKDDTVRFELDCEEGTVRCFVNGSDQGVVFDTGLQGKEIFPAICTYSGQRSAAFTKLEVLSGPGSSAAGVGGSGVPGTLSTPTGTVAALSTLPYLASGNDEAKPTVSKGAHFYQKGQLDAGESAAASPIVVAGSPRANGLSLRPLPDSKEGEASVTFPLQVLKTIEDKENKENKDKDKEKEKEDKKKEKDSKEKENAGKTHRPFEFFVAKLGVDDTSAVPKSASSSSSGSVVPVVITISLDDRAIYSTPPLSTPGETHFVRLPIKGAGNLKITAKVAGPLAVSTANNSSSNSSGASAIAKTVVFDAVVIEARDWSWSSRRTGILPGFRDSTDAAAGTSSEGEVAKPTTPLSLARFVASRLAFLSEAQNEVTKRGLVAVSKIARITGLSTSIGAATADGGSLPAGQAGGNAGGAGGGASGLSSSSSSSGGSASGGGSSSGGAGIDALIAAARAWIAQQDKEKDKSKPSSSTSSESDAAQSSASSSSSSSNTTISTGDVFAAEGLRKLQSPLCLDVCAATFSLLRSLLAVALPYCYAENGDLFDLQAQPESAADQASNNNTAAAASAGSSSATGTNAEIDAAAAAAGSPNAPTAAHSRAAVDAVAASSAASRPWTTLCRDLLSLVKSHLRRLVGSQVDPAAVGIRLLAGPGASAAATSAAGSSGSKGKDLLASLAQGIASRGDTTTTVTRTRSGAAGVAALPSLSSVVVNPVNSALAAAFGNEGDGAAASASIAAARKEGVSALQREFQAGGGSASSLGTSAEPTLAPLHRLLQLIVEDQDPRAQAASESETEEEDETDEEAAAAAEKKETVATTAASSSSASATASPHRSRLTAGVQSAAADAIDAALSVLYPSQAERRKLLSGLISKGGVVEIQFRFPALRSDGIAEAAAMAIVAAERQAREEENAAADGKDKDKKDKDKDKKEKEKKEKDKKDKEKEAAMWERRDKEREEALKRKFSRDPRPDRALLLLQLECQKRGISHHVYGHWGSYMHLLIRLTPSTAAAAPASTTNDVTSASSSAASASAASAKAVEFLDSGFSRVFERAGLGPWNIPTGCADPHIPLKIERVLDFTAPDRTFSEGVGLVRIFPRSAGTFKAIDGGVRSLVEGYKQNAALQTAAAANAAAGKAGGAGAAAAAKKK